MDLDQVGQLTAADVMTTPALACREEAFFEEVAELLASRDVSGLPVVDANDQVVGVISERDLAHALGNPLVRLALRRSHNAAATRSAGDLPREARRIKGLMTSPPVVASSDAPISEIARVMVADRINRIPIVDDGRLVGMVTRHDLLQGISSPEPSTVRIPEKPIILGSGVQDGQFAHRRSTQ